MLERRDPSLVEGRPGPARRRLSSADDALDRWHLRDQRHLLVIGDRSPVVTLDLALELLDLNPRLRIEQIQDAGHGLPFDQPERLAAVARSFVRELMRS